MLSRMSQTMVDGRTRRDIAHGADADREQVKQDLGSELREASFTEGEIEELFRPDRPMH
jgi:hypothetical protein